MPSATSNQYRIGGALMGAYPEISKNNFWRIANPFRLTRVDTLRQISHKPESGSAAFWRFASTKHANVKRVTWQGGEPPFRLTIFKNDIKESETVWIRTQSLINPIMYDHTFPEFGYEHSFQPSAGENGSSIKYTYLIESQDNQALVINAITQVDNSRFKYFAPSPAGNNLNPGTFESPYETFGYGYSSVTNAQNLIFCYKSGTYQVHNGTPMNDAAFDNSHCKSHVGIESGVVMDVSTGNFSAGTTDIYVANFTVTGGRADKENVRQFDLDGVCSRLHAHSITGDTTFAGSVRNDNPSTFMLWDLTGDFYHEDISFTDCKLSATSLSQFATLFSCKNVIVENFKSLSPSVTAENGGQHFHLKDGCLNVTFRHSELVGQSTDGLLNVASQSWEKCGNVDIHFCKLINTKPGDITVSRWNVQVHSEGMQMPPDYYIQRCDIDAYQAVPLTVENYENAGDPVHYSAIRWESTSTIFNNGENSETSVVSIGNTTVKVADINTYSTDDLGVRGYKISSTLVI